MWTLVCVQQGHKAEDRKPQPLHVVLRPHPTAVSSQQDAPKNRDTVATRRCPLCGVTETEPPPPGLVTGIRPPRGEWKRLRSGQRPRVWWTRGVPRLES